MRVFQPKKGNFWIYIVLSLLLPLALVIGVEGSLQYPIVLPACLPFVLFVWIYFSTKYFILKDNFYYQSAFLKGKIAIHKISSIQSNKTMWSGVKPALATKGLIIKFGFDEVYVAPKSNEELIAALVQINPKIRVE